MNYKFHSALEETFELGYNTSQQDERGEQCLPLPPLMPPLPKFSRLVVSDSLQPHGLQHVRPPCPSRTPRVYSDSCPLSRRCHLTISSSVIPFSSHLQSFPASASIISHNTPCRGWDFKNSWFPEAICCCCSVTQSCPTLCNLLDCSMSGLPVHHQHPELAQTRVH